MLFRAESLGPGSFYLILNKYLFKPSRYDLFMGVSREKLKDFFYLCLNSAWSAFLFPISIEQSTIYIYCFL